MKDHWLTPFFADPIEKDDEIEDMSEEEKILKELTEILDKEKQTEMEKLQDEALRKQKERESVMGKLIRSKGFLWLATSNNLIGAWQQAGNVLRIKAEGKWMGLNPKLWEGTSIEPLVRRVRCHIDYSLFPIGLIIDSHVTFLMECWLNTSQLGWLKIDPTTIILNYVIHFIFPGYEKRK